MNKRKTALLIFTTFVLTSVLYTAAFTAFPAAGNALGNLLSSVAGTDNRELKSKLKAIDGYIDKYYINDYDKSEMSDLALTAYVSGLDDPYTEYISKDSYKDMKEQLSGDYTGIGVEIYLDADGYMTIISVFDNAPAAKAGILPGDRITEVNNMKVTKETYTKAVQTMRGSTEDSPEDATVTLKILRGEESFDVSLKREAVVNQTVQTKLLENGIGYIRISQFDESTGSDFDRLSKLLISDGAKSFIIDLRDNPGGVLTGVVSVADTLLGKGKIITIKDKSGKETVYNSDEDETDLPMCVLINSGSASASEVLAGALRDHKKATLIGTKSFGKGVVQTIFDFSDGSAFKVTTAKYYTPNGECIHGKGIEPDITVEMTAEKPIQALEADEDVQLKKAIEILEK